MDKQLVYLDGVPIGTVTAGDDNEVSDVPQSVPLASSRLASLGDPAMPFHAPSRGQAPVGHSPERRGPTFRPHVRPHGAAPEHAPEKHGPTFRRGMTPRGAADPAKPEHFSVADVKSAVEQTPHGEINRQHHAQYLAAHPELREKILSIMKNEQGVNRLGTQAVAEETFNRADVRGHSLERVARWTREPGGYYAGYTPRVTDPKERAILNESLDKALAGSNVSNYATDNSSGRLAQREARGGEFTYAQSYTGETFWTRNSEAKAHEAWKARAHDGMSGKPVGVTRLGAAPGSAPAPAGASPSAASGSDLDYLASRGGHSSVDRVSKPVGATMGFDPELAARLRAAGEAYEKETGGKAVYGEGDRDVATQQYYWNDSAHGTRYRAAPPGLSMHQKGMAMDLPDTPFRKWLKEGNMDRFGLHFPVNHDAPHVQANPAFKGSFGKQSALPARTKVANLSTKDYTNDPEYEGPANAKIREDQKKSGPGPVMPLGSPGTDPRFAPFLPQIRDIRRT
jgi:hypothetical protein